MRGRRDNRRTYGFSHNRSGFEDLRSHTHFAGGGRLEFKGQNTDANFTKAEADAHNKAWQELQQARNDPTSYAREHGLTISQATKDIENKVNQLNSQQYGDIYQKNVVGDPLSTEAGRMDKASQDAAAQQAFENRWKGKLGGGSTPEEKADSLRAYQESLKKARDSGYKAPKTRAEREAAFQTANDKAKQQAEERKAAQYRDTMAAKEREKQFKDQLENNNFSNDAMGQSLRQFEQDRNQRSAQYADSLHKDINMADLEKLEADTDKTYRKKRSEEFAQNYGWGDSDETLADRGATIDDNGNITDPTRENAWKALTDIPVLGDIVGGLDKLSGGMIQKGTQAGQDFGQGNWREGIGGLIDAGTQAAQMYANPGQTLADNAMGMVMEKVLPQPAAEAEPEGYEQDYGQYDSSPHIQSMMNPSASQRQYIGQANQPYLNQAQNYTPRSSASEAGENYGYMSGAQRAAQHQAYNNSHQTPGQPAPQASPPPPATGTTAPPGVSQQQSQSQNQTAPQTLKGGGTVGHSFYRELHSMRRSHGGSADKWIQKALPPSSHGKLRENLDIPAGQKIPMKRLMQAEHSSNPTIRKEAQLADRLRHFHNGCR